MISEKKQLPQKQVGKKSKKSVNFSDWIVLLESIKESDCENVRVVLKRSSFDLNQLNESGFSALHLAVLENSIELVQLLLDSRADINVCDKDRWTPLHTAASLGFYEMSRFLLENGADCNAMTIEGLKPVDLVDENESQSQSELVLLFLNHARLHEK